MKNQWHPIETAPKGKVLVFDKNYGMKVSCNTGTDDNKYWAYDSHFYATRQYPTHWMPLPKRPERFSNG